MKNEFLQTTSAEYLSNDEGVASIEFAIIAPFMLMMYFGLAQVASAISVDRRVSHGANVAGDMVTQAPEATAEDMEEILSATIRVMGVQRADLISMDIESFILDASGDPESHGRVQLNPTSALAESFDASTLDTRILSETSGVVVTRVRYIYSPIVKSSTESEFSRANGEGTKYKAKKFQGDVTLTETFLLKPRRSDVVEIASDVPGSLVCTASGYRNVSCPVAAAVASGG